MKAFFKICIFCSTELPPPQERGGGEHIVPDLLYGSIRTKDVCRSCNSHFGEHVDHLILREPRLVAAAFELDLPALQQKIEEKADVTLTDVHTGKQYPGNAKAGNVEVKPNCSDPDNWIMPEDDLRKALKSKVKKEPPPGVLENEVADRIDQLFDREAESGDSVSDERLGLELRKSEASVSARYKPDVKAGHRLAAKIAYEAAHVMMPPPRLACLEGDLLQLAEFAWTGQGDTEVRIFPSRDAREPRRSLCRHAILVQFKEHSTFVDIHLFGTVSYRVTFCGGGADGAGPVDFDGVRIDGFGVAMTFRPGESRKKTWCIREAGTTEPVWYEGPFL